LAAGGWTPTGSLAILAAGACVGGLVGAYLGSRVLDHRWLRMLLSGVLLIAGGKLILQ